MEVILKLSRRAMWLQGSYSIKNIYKEAVALLFCLLSVHAYYCKAGESVLYNSVKTLYHSYCSYDNSAYSV